MREAKWVARLSVLVQDIERLSWQASHYAFNESLYDLVERYFDSTLLDWFFMRIPIPILSKIEEDEQRQEFTFVTGLVAEGLKGESFEGLETGFLAILASRKDIKEYLAEAKKVMKEWKAYKKEVQDEG